MKDKDNEQLPAKKPFKKVYYQPELQVYGTLGDITQHIGQTGVLDNLGVPPNNRTST